MVRIIILLYVLSFSQLRAQRDSLYHHCFFPKSSFSVATGLSLNGPSIGFPLRTYYNLNRRFCFGPELILTPQNGLELELNLVGHYIFELGPLGFYPLIGWQFQFEVESQLKEVTEGNSNSALGGIGLHRNWQSWGLFLEWSQAARQKSKPIWSLGVLKTF